MAVHLPNPKYIPKPYEKMQYPGQSDVKYVPTSCLVGVAAEEAITINIHSLTNTAVPAI